MVFIASLLSPTGFLGCTLVLLVPLGFGGLAVCAVSLAWEPRWPGIVGLVMGMLCVLGWIALFAWSLWTVQGLSSQYGFSPGQFAQMGMSKMALVEAAEAQRSADGGPASLLDFSVLPRQDRNDPWGSPYRYVLVNSPRGFTFMSDGPDGASNTPDDIDLLLMDQAGMFEPVPAPASSRPSGPSLGASRPSALRRTIRRRRGQCAAFGYPAWGGGRGVGARPVCTKCGAALKTGRGIGS